MSITGWFRKAVSNAVVGALEYALPGGVSIDFHDPDGTGRNEIRAGGEHCFAYYSNAYRACAMAKARPLASLPVHVYERRDGVRLESKKYVATDLAKLLRGRWNPFLTAQEGFRWLDVTKDAMGDAFVRAEWSGGRVVALWPMSSKPDVLVSAGGSPVFRYGGDKFTRPGNYLPHEIVWVKSPIIDADGLHGVSLAKLAADEIGLSIDLESFYKHILSGSNHFPGWLETDQKLDPQDIDKLKKGLSDGKGIVNAGAIRIFDKGLTYHSVNQSMVDMSLVDQERWILQQTCRTLSVPPQEVFDLSNATYSNIEQGALNFANKTLVPECAEIERAFTCLLHSAGLDDCYVQFDLNGLLRGSYRDRMEGYRIGIYTGIYSPNDVRAMEEKAPYEGGGLYLRPSAYIPVDPETGEEMEGARRAVSGDTGGSGEGSPPYSGSGDGEALASIHEDMASRVRQRFSERGDDESSREFAAKVLAPYSRACTAARIPYDMEADIERLADEAR